MRTAILLQFLIFVSALLPSSLRADVFRAREVAVFEIQSAITPATFDYLKHHFAHSPKDALLLIKMNTPGGLITTTKDIITLIGVQDRPIVVWITPEGASASSAGAIIAAAAHFIIMSPGSNIGAATPVGLGQDMKEGDGKSKALNDLSALVRSLNTSRGRPPGPFEEMIKTAKSFTNKEALDLEIINGVASAPLDVLDIIRGKPFILKGKPLTLEIESTALTNEYKPTAGQILLTVLADPSTAYFLFLIGVALLYFEFQAPGGYIAGGVGVVFLIIAAIAFQVLPLDWGSLGLIAIGVVLLVLEIYITSYGILGLGGIVAFIIGSLFLFHGESGFISIDYPVIISTLLGIGTGIGIITWYVVRESKKKYQTDFFQPNNSEGIVMALNKGGSRPLYQVKVRGEIWKGYSNDELSVGEKVVVVSTNSEQLTVELKKIT